MIQQKLVISEQNNWLLQLKNSIKSPLELLKILKLNPDEFNQDILANKLFNLQVPLNFVEKMEKGNPKDPLFLQVMPSKYEFINELGFSKDPLDEQTQQVKNILHKYHNRLILMLKPSCAINCRYCFRRHFPYQQNKGQKSSWLEGLEYIANNPQIEEVILSGGDPMLAKDSEFAFIIDKLEQIKSVKTIRIHSRVPIVLPSRITKELCELFNKTHLNIVLVLHCNHPNEIDDFFIQKMGQLTKVGVTLLNQSVLLKGVNDSAMTLKLLSDKLFQAKILPYYLHVLDQVEGAEHFYLDDDNARKIYLELQSLQSGYLVPKLSRELAHHTNKTLLV